MELASYYHSVFLQERLHPDYHNMLPQECHHPDLPILQESLHLDYHNISLHESHHPDLLGLLDSNTSDYESAASSPACRDPCWDLESVEDGDLYRLQEYSHLYRPETDFTLKTEPSTCYPSSRTPTTSTPPTLSTPPKPSPSSCMPPTPSVQLLQRRRTAANARERKRMTRINTAFGRLRQILPGQRTSRELSKMEALQAAQEYILRLADLLRKTPA